MSYRVIVYIQQRKAVVLTARVHPGETNASWMMKGFLDFLLGGCKEAKVNYIICIISVSYVGRITPLSHPSVRPSVYEGCLSLWVIGTVRAETETVISLAWVQSPDPAE